LEPRLQELEDYGLVGPDFIMAAQAEALKAAILEFKQGWHSAKKEIAD
jgi:hypothetical protein